MDKDDTSVDTTEVDYVELDNDGPASETTSEQAPQGPETPVATPAAPETPQVPAQPQATTVPLPVAQPAVPVVAPGLAPPVAQQPPLTQPVAAPVPPPGPTTEQQAQVLLQQRTGLVNEIASRYALSEQDKELYLTEPEKVIPQLVGRLHVDVFESVFQAVYAQLPKMMADFAVQQKAADSRESSFYERWPVFNKPEYKPHVDRLAALYRQFNPGASFEQLKEDLGVQALIALKIPFDQVAPSAPTPPATPQTPVPQSSGFRPAAPSGAVPATRAGQPTDNVWSELVNILD